jgi:predicted enzyme related to lactoylglutathione lyase
MAESKPNPVVHLELHTCNLPRACGFYSRMFGWRPERVQMGGGTYLSVDIGSSIEAGVVERDAEQTLWLPYVQVPDVCAATERARELGARVEVEPREGPVGWRSVLAAPDGADIALWQPKS